MIDGSLLRALGAGNSASELYAPLLAEVCPLWSIDEPREVVSFLANCTHESARFTTLVENLNYSAQGLANTWARFSVTGKKGGVPNALALRLHKKPVAIANEVYANRFGNGDPNSGDGWRMRGRGLIQVTFTDNYYALSEATGTDYLRNPDLLMEPEHAVISACWYWRDHGCNEIAQSGDWLQLRKQVNGGTNGLQEVNSLIETGLQYLGVE